MKKLCSILLCLVMLLTLLPAGIFGVSAEENSGVRNENLALDLNADPTNSVEQTVETGYDHAYDIVFYQKLKDYKSNIDSNGRITVDTTGFGITRKNLFKVVKAISVKYPDLFYVDFRALSSSNGEIIDFIKFRLWPPIDEIDTMVYKYNRALQEIYVELDKQGIDAADDLGKTMIIYNYICLNTWFHGGTTGVTYSHTCPAFYNAHNSYGVIVNHLGVCEGYARAFRLIAEHYGLKVGYVESLELNHAWNVVQINGEWYHVDPTWGDRNSTENICVDPNIDSSFSAALNDTYLAALDKSYSELSSVFRDYFLLTESQLLKKSPERADMTIILPEGETYSSAQTTITVFWNNLLNNTYLYNGKWYFVDHKITDYSQRDINLVCCNTDGSDMQKIITKQYECNYADIRYFTYQYEAKSFGLNGDLYYSTPTEIRKYHIATGEDTLYYAPTLEKNFFITDIAYIMGNLVVEERAKYYRQSQHTDEVKLIVLCGDDVDISTHTYDNDCDPTCNYCGKTRTVSHTFDSGCGTICLICGYTKDVPGQGHVFDDSCDAVCNACGFIRKVTHDHTEYVVEHPWSHWEVCSDCGKVLSGQSKHEYDDHFDTTCNVCGYVREIPHEYDSVCDDECNICGYKRTAPHTYSTKCDTDCDSCGHIRTVTHTPITLQNIASTMASGEIWAVCDDCGEILSHKVVPKIGTATISKTYCVYNGEVQKPTVIVVDINGNKLKQNTDYTLSYSSGCKDIGTYNVKITFKGNYGGTKTLSFKIVPKNVSGLKATQTTSSVKLTWSKSADAKAYAIYTYNASTKKYTKIGSTTGTSFTKSKLKAGTAYTFYVRAYNGAYVSANLTKIATATKPANPIVTVTPGSKQATVSWKKASGAAGYQVYYSTAKSSGYKKVTTTTALKTTKKSLKKGKTYYFRVRSYKKVGSTYYYSGWVTKSVKVK